MSSAVVQPSFAELGSALSETTFCVVDLETTGGSADDSITEFGAVKVCGGEVVGEFQTLVNPPIAIPPLIAVLTGITNAAVASAPRLAAVLPTFLEFLGNAVLVAHNARFDVGFLQRACRELDRPWPQPIVLDTAALARVILLRDEVANNKLGTLARHFRSPTVPNHRALTDAQATVDVLHGLIERVGNLGVRTVEDLVEFSRRVSPQRRAKRSWAVDLPESPGVYWFVTDPPVVDLGETADADPTVRLGALGSEEAGGDRVLYVGKATSLKTRVRSYFTASETRRRMDEMVRVATGLRHLVCQTGLQAEVCELRMIAAHAPQYNRRSKYPHRQHWVKLTVEPFPRISVVRAVRDDDATYFGPLRHRHAVDDVVAALHDAFPIRQCTPRMAKHPTGSPCALAGMGRCVSPCDGSIDLDGYGELIGRVRHTLTADVRPALSAVSARLARLIEQERFEEAEVIRRRLTQVVHTARRHHRVASLAAVPELVAAYRTEAGWEIHVIRHGRLAQAALARPGEVPQAVARSAVATAETVARPVPPLPAATIEETERIAAWLERPGVRIIDIDGDWCWPLHATIELSDLGRIALPDDGG